jgi:DNA segregation ATPase FtsK/SpoIIIE, S-DNA-T family
MNAEQGFWLQLMMLIMVLSVWGLLRVLAAYRQYQRAPELMRIGKPLAVVGNDIQAVAGAGAALARPPDLEATLRVVAEQAPTARYRFSLGWSVLDSRPALSQASFVGDVNHILLTAQSDGGKDTWAIGVLLGLAACHPPHELQLCIIDGKGLDFVGWRNLPHVWRAALRPEDIAGAMQALSAERERRRRILSAAGVSKWDAYGGGDLPLLVTYVSELALLADATSPKILERWLNSELAAGRAFGMRYIVATQTASNFATRWRSQISLYIAGFQPSQSQDTPNTSLRTNEIVRAGAVPPSELPAPPTGAGVFCVVFGRDSINVRAPLVDDAERKRWLEALGAASAATTRSDALEVLPPLAERALIDTSGSRGSKEAPLVTDEERAAIIAAAQQESSRRRVCLRVFNTTGGRAWEKVKLICDQERLLIGDGRLVSVE